MQSYGTLFSWHIRNSYVVRQSKFTVIESFQIFRCC